MCQSCFCRSLFFFNYQRTIGGMSMSMTMSSHTQRLNENKS